MRCLLPAIIIGFFLSFTASAQDAKDVTAPLPATVKKDSLPYQRFPSLPAFNIMLADSATIFNTYNIPGGKPIALMLFDPDCKHCKDLTKRMLAAMDSLQDIQFYMLTPAHSMAAIRKFSADFHLADYKNVRVVGRDYEFFFHEYYGVKFVPDIALYDKNKTIIKLFEANATVQDLYEATHK